MVAGFDRYFQIVKCFRDEDLRLDRQPEFTQIDVEMSFVNQDDIFRTMEGLIFSIWKTVLGIDLHERYPSGRFPQMKFDESMARYGNDKPDLRFDLPHVDLTDLVIETGGGGIPFWKEIADKFTSGKYRRDLPAEIVKALRIPASANLSRAEADKLEEFVKRMGAKGLARAKVDAQGNWTQSPLAKTITPELRAAINAKTEAKDGDLLVFQFGKESVVQTVMANLRVHVAKKMGLIPESGHGGHFNFLWVVDPPLFEYDEERKTWAAAHHAFTRPHDDCVPMLDTDPGKVLCHRYNLVLNGFEDRRRVDPPPRPRGAGEGVPRARHRGGGGAAEVRVPPRRPALRRPAPRWDRASAWTAWRCSCPAPRACETSSPSRRRRRAPTS